MTDIAAEIAAEYPESVAAFAPSGRLVWCNLRFAEHFGAATGVTELGDIVDLPQAELGRVMRQSLSTTQPMPLRLGCRTASGDLQTLRVEHWRHAGTDGPLAIYRFFDRSMDPSRFQFLTETVERLNAEVTARRVAEETLRDAIADAMEANALKDRLIAEVSHNMRTPLNAIIGFSDALLVGIRGDLPEGIRGYLRDINDSGHMLLGFIERILETAPRLRTSQRLAEHAVNLSDCIAACRRAVEPLVRDKALHILLPAGHAPARLAVEEAAINAIVLNLLDNAAKFTPPGGEIRVELERTQDAGLTIAVHDNGPGIAPSDIPKVTQPFYRSGDPYVSAVSGYGLGLAATKQRLDELGGSLEIESVLGQGTTMRARLPADVVRWPG